MKAAPVLMTLTTIMMLLSGCSSSFVGHKLGSTRDKQHPIVNTGIPVTMNRPEFQLTVAKEKVGDKEQLVSTIAVKWVPDNSQRYTLSLKPAPFTKSSFTHTFDQDGNFTAGAGSVESRVVTTITTVGELARSFLRPGVFDVIDPDVTHPVQTLGDEIGRSEDPACTVPHQKDLFASHPPVEGETVSAVIVSRWKRYSDDGERIAEGGGVGRVLDRIHFTSEQERKCFEAIRKQIARPDRKALIKTTKLEKDFVKRLGEFESTHGQDTSFKVAKDEIVKLLKELDYVRLTELYEELNNPDSEGYDGGEFGDFRRLLAQKAVRIAKKKFPSRFTMTVLDAILHMRPQVWRARQALELSERIERIAARAAQYPPGSVRIGYVKFGRELNAELDQILGTSDTTTQITNLEAYLAKEVPLLAGAHVQRYVVDDRVKVATQLEALRDAYTKAKSLVVGMNEPIPEAGLPKPQPCNCPSLPAPTAELELVNNLVIPTADAGFVKQVGAKLPKKPPPYVLVIEPANGLPKHTPSTGVDRPAEGVR